MSRTRRGRPYGRCPEPDCTYCVQGAARGPWHREARRAKRLAIRRTVRDPEHAPDPFDVVRPPNRR